jgi:hypothetical protein
VAFAASARPAPSRRDEYRPDPDRWMALAVCLAAGFMTLLDVSIVNTALPSIELGLHSKNRRVLGQLPRPEPPPGNRVGLQGVRACLCVLRAHHSIPLVRTLARYRGRR